MRADAKPGVAMASREIRDAVKLLRLRQE